MRINKPAILEQYTKLIPLYKRACHNTKEALEQFLEDSNIPFIVITTRVKSRNSFSEKIDRKNYFNPFAENEDFCGVRVILYYQNDIIKVGEIINNNYELQESSDKADKLEFNAFGYRSNHSIVKIKESWCVSSNYKDLEDIKIEIQVRTVLMHAWAEIEHELGYKSKEYIPPLIERKFSQLSAILENTDLQFQEIKQQSHDYKNKLLEDSEKFGKFIGKELNLETLQALLNFYFPKYEPYLYQETHLLNRILKAKINIFNLSIIANKIIPYTSFIDERSSTKKTGSISPQANMLTYGIEVLIPHTYLLYLLFCRRPGLPP